MCPPKHMWCQFLKNKFLTGAQAFWIHRLDAFFILVCINIHIIVAQCLRNRITKLSPAVYQQLAIELSGEDTKWWVTSCEFFWCPRNWTSTCECQEHLALVQIIQRTSFCIMSTVLISLIASRRPTGFPKSQHPRSKLFFVPDTWAFTCSSQ